MRSARSHRRRSGLLDLHRGSPPRTGITPVVRGRADRFRRRHAGGADASRADRSRELQPRASTLAGCGAGRHRTFGLAGFSRALYLLSYRSVERVFPRRQRVTCSSGVASHDARPSTLDELVFEGTALAPWAALVGIAILVDLPDQGLTRRCSQPSLRSTARGVRRAGDEPCRRFSLRSIPRNRDHGSMSPPTRWSSGSQSRAHSGTTPPRTSIDSISHLR